jgi:hypothetical protein
MEHAPLFLERLFHIRFAKTRPPRIGKSRQYPNGIRDSRPVLLSRNKSTQSTQNRNLATNRPDLG